MDDVYRFRPSSNISPIREESDSEAASPRTPLNPLQNKHRTHLRPGKSSPQCRSPLTFSSVKVKTPERSNTQAWAASPHPFNSNDRENFPDLDSWLENISLQSSEDGEVIQGGNGFDSDVESEASAISNALDCSDVQCEKQGGSMFEWSIDGKANLFPVERDEQAGEKIDPDHHHAKFTPRRQMQQREYETRVQTEIEKFFSPSKQIVPSPWVGRSCSRTSHTSEFAHSNSGQATTMTSSARVLPSIPLETGSTPTSQTIGCQTEYTWPMDAPLPIPIAAIYPPSGETSLNNSLSLQHVEKERVKAVPIFVFDDSDQEKGFAFDMSANSASNHSHSMLRDSAHLRSLSQLDISDINDISKCSQQDIDDLARLCDQVSLEISLKSRRKLEELANVAANIADELGPSASKKAEKLLSVCQRLCDEINYSDSDFSLD